MRERIARVEAVIPTLATKADVAELRADIERGQKENRAWMLATVLGLFVGILAVGSFFLNGSTRAASTPAQPPPIIINVPNNQATPVPATPPSDLPD